VIARSGGPRRAGWARWVACALPAAVASWPFLQVAGHAFIQFDDDRYVTENPFVREGVTWAGVQWAWTASYAANWHPLTWLSHMVDVQLFGLDAGAHHLVNVLLHAANAGLLGLVLVRLTGAVWRSALVAALFAVHPLHVESVAWVAERKDLLSTLFGLAMLWAYARHARRPGPARLALVALCLSASLLAKAMWVTAPFLLLLLDVWPLRRVRWGGAAAGEPHAEVARVPLARLVAEKVPLLVLCLASSVMTVVAQGRGGALDSLERTGLAARLGNAAVSYVRYLGMTFWPADLAVFYPLPAGGPPAWQVLGAAVVLVAISAWVLHARRDAPWLVFGWCWYLGMLVPVIGIVQVGSQALADRYTYVPLTGILVAVVWEAERRLGRFTRRTAALALPAVAVVAVLSIVTVRQVARWRDQETLFRHTAAVTEDNAIAHHLLSVELARQGRYAEALVHAREAVRSSPADHHAQKNLGFVLYRIGLVDDAIVALRRAIELKPGFGEAHENLAIAYGRKGWTEEAMREMALGMKLSAAERAERARR
jgi:hypothetical protein